MRDIMYLEPTIPITNEELYKMAGEITIGQMGKQGFIYTGDILDGNSIRFERPRYGIRFERPRYGIVVLIRDSDGMPPIAINGLEDSDQDRLRIKTALSGLLKCDLEEVEMTVGFTERGGH